MKQSLFQEKYPIYTLEVSKSECKYPTLEELLGYFRQRIEEHPVAGYIADFDHYAHTAAQPEGKLEEGLVAARNLVFCFGTQLLKPEMLALRPRSIGVAEYADRFVISFLEAPMPAANEAMEAWAKAVVA